MPTTAQSKFREAALDYHEFPTPGKIAIAPTKLMINQRDLSLAYSPGVAFACEEIVENPLNAARFTARSNLVGVVTNGTAVLGLGNIGPLASKPVMEGKAVLFKKFAGIDVFDIELNESDPHKLVEVIGDADIFLGLSAGGVLKTDMVAQMGKTPLILALANPTPEIEPDLARGIRPDAILATGRADYPNQVNNVLVFPFIFRGALDVGATTVTREMEIAAVNAIAELARQEQSDIVATAYGIQDLSFGPEYLIPKPFDPRLIVKVAAAVAKAAMESGVATRPIEDMIAYEQHLQQFVYRSGATMQPIFQLARSVKPEKKRIVFAEGEDERVLRAIQIVVDEKLAKPILIGRPAVIEQRIARYGLRLVAGQDYTMVNTDHDERYRDFWQTYHKMMARKGISEQMAKLEMRRRTTLIGSMLMHKGEADGMICGTISTTHRHLHFIDQVIGKR
ncbi:hypothetical protein IQ286_38335, partial [Burkholderia sp. R-69749]|nr:hypothetical protein [Burkholderia sp. R-69749]